MPKFPAAPPDGKKHNWAGIRQKRPIFFIGIPELLIPSSADVPVWMPKVVSDATSTVRACTKMLVTVGSMGALCAGRAGGISTDAQSEIRLHDVDDNDKRFGRVPGLVGMGVAAGSN